MLLRFITYLLLATIFALTFIALLFLLARAPIVDLPNWGGAAQTRLVPVPPLVVNSVIVPRTLVLNS